MFAVENLLDCGSIAGSAYNIVQSQRIHNNEVSSAKKRHEESIALSVAQHEKDMKIAKQTYLMAAFTTLEQHFQQLNADLISSSKESESDMFDQRNQCFQTVILSATIMFSSLVTVIFQGFLPVTADSFLFISYALTSALAFAFLFLSIVLCVEVLLRASSFMYDRATNHTKQLREAIQKTKTMMQKIRVGEVQIPPREKKSNKEGRRSSIHEKFAKHNPIQRTSDDSSGESRKRSTKNYNDATEYGNTKSRQIAEMKEEDLQIEWERHEAEVHRYLEEREKINDQTSVLVSADANSSRMSFEQFWRESCKVWGDIAILFFYAGTANLLLAIMIYMWAEFFLVYHNIIGAVLAVLVVGISIVVGIALYLFLRQSYYLRHKRNKSRSSHSAADSDYSICSEKSKRGGASKDSRLPSPSLEIDPSLVHS